jgi:hypothetical protein
MDFSDPAQQRLAGKTIEYAFRLEPIVRAYYAQHQETGCTCELCKRAERALASIGHAVGMKFTVREMPDGTYSRSREMIEETQSCPQCHRLVTEHTREEMRACLQSQRDRFSSL